MRALNRVVSNWSDTIELWNLRRKAAEANGEIENVLERSKQAAGQIADSHLSIHFNSLSEREKKVATRFRSFAIVCLVATSLFAIYTAHDLALGDHTVPAVLTRMAFLLPILILTGYLVRESSAHRRHSQWSEEVNVKLKTLDAYLAPLPQEYQQTLRAEFGREVFKIPMKDSSEADPRIGALTELNQLIDRIREGVVK